MVKYLLSSTDGPLKFSGLNFGVSLEMVEPCFRETKSLLSSSFSTFLSAFCSTLRNAALTHSRELVVLLFNSEGIYYPPTPES